MGLLIIMANYIMRNMKTETLCVTLPADLRKKLIELAKKESRNVSNMTAVLLDEAIKKKAI